MFNPKNNFWIPGFSEFPSKDIDELNQAKFKYVREVQESSSNGTSFVLQNRILRIIDWTMMFIQNKLKITDESLQRTHMEYILAMAYKTAIMEFPRAYGPKIIDWSSFESKPTETIPYWRKANETPPEDIPSVYSKTILQKIDNGSILFQGKAIAERSAEFMEETVQSKVRQSSSQNYLKKRGHGRGGYGNAGTRGRGGRGGGGRGRFNQFDNEPQQQTNQFNRMKLRGQ